MKPLEERMKRERERNEIVQRAVAAADHIILSGSDGSNEETNWLTAQVAHKFSEKVLFRHGSELLHKDLED